MRLKGLKSKTARIRLESWHQLKYPAGEMKRFQRELERKAWVHMHVRFYPFLQAAGDKHTLSRNNKIKT